ncbi:MAG: IcmQ protein [Gammaproteobacteria bacterium]|nr:IcmQ protein [Gammaproteobacteria bacterium]
MGEHEVKDKLLAAIDKVIQEGHWDQGLFSKNILKRLQSLRQRIVDSLESEQDASASSQSFPKIPSHKEGHRRMYVAIYQAEGERMDRWLYLVKNLTNFSMSRPVYGEEEHVQELMRAKRGRNDAYIVLWVNERDILPPLGGILPFDRFGHELYSLRASGVKLENVIEFVHDGRRYFFYNDQLVLNEK